MIGIGAAVAGSLAPQSASAQAPKVRLAASHSAPEAHPTMLAAYRALLVARKNLEVSSHDFGGHRLKALALTEQAIVEVKAGVKYDDAHPDGH